MTPIDLDFYLKLEEFYRLYLYTDKVVWVDFDKNPGHYGGESVLVWHNKMKEWDSAWFYKNEGLLSHTFRRYNHHSTVFFYVQE